MRRTACAASMVLSISVLFLHFLLIVPSACGFRLSASSREFEKEAVASSEEGDSLILFDFIKGPEVYWECLDMLTELGAGAQDPEASKMLCVRDAKELADGNVELAKKHCAFFSNQLEIAYSRKMLKSKDQQKQYCGKIVMYQSNKKEKDMLKYFRTKNLHKWCGEAISAASQAKKPGQEPTVAVQKGLPTTCTQVLNMVFMERGYPPEIAGKACKAYVEKSDSAIMGGELNPADDGHRFCSGKSAEAEPFAKSSISPAPDGFPLGDEMYNPYITLEEYRKLILKEFTTLKWAFEKFDPNADDILDEKEWAKHCKELHIRPRDCTVLRDGLKRPNGKSIKGIDGTEERAAGTGNGDKKITNFEYQNALGVTVDELRHRVLERWGEVEKGFESADVDGDGFLTKKEWMTHCDDMNISPEQAELLFEELDADGDGKISKEEYLSALGGTGDKDGKDGKGGAGGDGKQQPPPRRSGPPGKEVSIPDFKDLLCGAFDGDLDKAFAAMAQGKEAALEDAFEEFCDKVGKIGPKPAKKLYRKLDKDSDQQLTAQEWKDALGICPDAIRRMLQEKFPCVDDLLKATDANGDGEISKEEFAKILEKELGLTPEQAKAAAEEYWPRMDKNGDGKVTAEEFKDHFRKTEDDIMREIKEMGTDEVMKKWDKDGDEKVSQEELEEALREMGVCEEDIKDLARKLMKRLDADGDGSISADELKQGAGIDGSDLRKACFEHYGNPAATFEELDKDKNGLLNEEEWTAGVVTKMKFSEEESKRLFNLTDSNYRENSWFPLGHSWKKEPGISKWEFLHFVHYTEITPLTSGDGYGDIDPMGHNHKKFNVLPGPGLTNWGDTHKKENSLPTTPKKKKGKKKSAPPTATQLFLKRHRPLS